MIYENQNFLLTAIIGFNNHLVFETILFNSTSSFYYVNDDFIKKVKFIRKECDVVNVVILPLAFIISGNLNFGFRSAKVMLLFL